MKKAYTVSQIRALEKIVIQKYGISEFELMQRAGKAAFECLRLNWPHIKHILVLCGTGNNGGDGYVLAMLAHQAGLKVIVRLAGDIQKLSETAKHILDICQTAGVEVLPYQTDEILSAELVVDALLGIGIKGEVRAPYVDIIKHVNKSEAIVLSLDIPSGIDADTGKILGEAILADATVTFVGLKQGLLTSRATTYCGRISCDTLGIELEQFTAIEASSEILNYDVLHTLLPARPRDTHKGDFGHVLILGGNHGMGGAACMAAEAAGRVGAGLVSVVMQTEYLGAVTAARPELMCYFVKTYKDLEPLFDRATVIILGAGLGKDAWARMLFSSALETNLPIILDADALNLLAEHPKKRDNWILTPHPGEAAKLLSCSTAEIQADRFVAANALVKNYGGTIVLKGAGTLIQTTHDLPKICTIGNPGMSTAGMGDVLGGIIGGLLAQRLTQKDAACLGVWLHAGAADSVAQQHGERGMLATDLMQEIRSLVNFHEYNINEM